MPPYKGFTEESLVTDEGQCWVCPSCRFVLFDVEVWVPSKTVSLNHLTNYWWLFLLFPHLYQSQYNVCPLPGSYDGLAQHTEGVERCDEVEELGCGLSVLTEIVRVEGGQVLNTPLTCCISRPRLPGKVDHWCPVRLLFWTDYILPVPLCLRRICWWRRPSQDSSSVRAKLGKFSEEISWQTCWYQGDSVHTDPCANPGPVIGRHYSVKIQHNIDNIFSFVFNLQFNSIE